MWAGVSSRYVVTTPVTSGIVTSEIVPHPTTLLEPKSSTERLQAPLWADPDSRRASGLMGNGIGAKYKFGTEKAGVRQPYSEHVTRTNARAQCVLLSALKVMRANCETAW